MKMAGSLYRNDKVKSVGVIFIIALMALAVSVQNGNNIFTRGETYTDSSVFKYVGWLITEGYMPYLDTFDHKGPVLYLLNALGVYISYWRGIWVIEYLTLLLTFLIMYKIARIFTNRFASVVALIFSTVPLSIYFQGGNFTEEYAMPCIAMALYIYIQFFRSGTTNRIKVFLCGLSCGLVFLLRPNMIAVWIVMSFGVIFVCLKQKRLQEIGRFVILFVLGMGAIILPVMLWLYSRGAMAAFIQDYFIFNTMYSIDPNRASLAHRLQSIKFFLMNPITLFTLFSLVYFYVRQKTQFNFIYIIYLIVSLLLISISGQKYGHYGMVLVPALIYPAAIVLKCSFSEIREVSSSWVLILSFMVAIALPGWYNAFSSTVKQSLVRNKSFMSENVRRITTYIEKTTCEDDTIIVCGNWDVFYGLSKRKAASKYSYQAPIAGINPRILQEFLADLESTPPVIAVVRPGNDNLSKEVKKFVEEHNYQMVDAGQKDWEMYRRPQ